jgi:hypothetical protein
VLHRANEHGRARGRNSAEIRHQLDAVLPCSENREVRNKLARRAGIQAQRVHANPRHIALVNEEPRRLLAEPGSVHHAIGVLIEKLLLAAGACIPPGVHRDERACRQAAVPLLPREQICD